MKMKCSCLSTYLHEDAKNAKKKRKRKKTKNAKERKKTQNAYFQERRCIFSRTKTQKNETKTQILGERCQLSSGEYCTPVALTFDKHRSG